VKGYWYWITNGEVESQQYDFAYSTSEIPEPDSASHTNHDYNECDVDRMEYMISDAILANQNVRDEVRINLGKIKGEMKKN